jgi:hypothetical protein
MEIQLFYSILNTELNPLKMDPGLKKKLRESLFEIPPDPPGSLLELTNSIRSMIGPLFELDQKLIHRFLKHDNPVYPLLYTCDLPVYQDGDQKYFQVLITRETSRVFNEFIYKASRIQNGVRHAEKLLKKIEVLTRKVTDRINKIPYLEEEEDSGLLYFVLTYMKLQCILLYFSIQYLYKEQIKRPKTLDEFYLLILEETVFKIKEIVLQKKNLKNVSGLFNNKKEKKMEKVQFLYKRELMPLLSVVDQLTAEINFINDSLSKPQDLVAALSSKNYIPGTVTIHLGCPTNQARYIINKLQPAFGGLTLTNIVKSQLFISKSGKPITRYSLSGATQRNSDNPKQKKVIDTIMNELYTEEKKEVE